MSGIGCERWACGRPMFYNVCISLGQKSGPVIHGHPPPTPSTDTHSHAPATTSTHTHAPATITTTTPTDNTQPPPVITQPTAATDQAEARQTCGCGEDSGGSRCGVEGRGHCFGCPSGKDGAAGEDVTGKEALHRTVITMMGRDSDEAVPQDEESTAAAGGTPVRRYSTVVSLGACGRALCTTRAQDHPLGGLPLPADEELESELLLLRKVSHTSDYSLSSRSDSSLSSASITPTTTYANHDAPDSDYFGSSSEEEEEEEDKDSDIEEEEEDSDGDIKETLQAAMARLRVREQRLGMGVRRTPSWRRRSHFKVSPLPCHTGGPLCHHRSCRQCWLHSQGHSTVKVRYNIILYT